MAVAAPARVCQRERLRASTEVEAEVDEEEGEEREDVDEDATPSQLVLVLVLVRVRWWAAVGMLPRLEAAPNPTQASASSKNIAKGFADDMVDLPLRLLVDGFVLLVLILLVLLILLLILLVLLILLPPIGLSRRQGHSRKDPSRAGTGTGTECGNMVFRRKTKISIRIRKSPNWDRGQSRAEQEGCSGEMRNAQAEILFCCNHQWRME